ncbi:hypothetical protein BJF81_01105 [Ornithinimicrobium sp. CNJ-824]|uniref:hypothetical protein n=1 Tax=Ornithinimicrobium kibberense TaxID=282060 RepID=UPI000967AC9E|nr:hypothetical protein BJF81_01105 [Ornithinimicrobium sp. CNJ-824]
MPGRSSAGAGTGTVVRVGTEVRVGMVMAGSLRTRTGCHASRRWSDRDRALRRRWAGAGPPPRA